MIDSRRYSIGDPEPIELLADGYPKAIENARQSDQLAYTTRDPKQGVHKTKRLRGDLRDLRQDDKAHEQQYGRPERKHEAGGDERHRTALVASIPAKGDIRDCKAQYRRQYVQDERDGIRQPAAELKEHAQ